jgi:hypothetical protein
MIMILAGRPVGQAKPRIKMAKQVEVKDRNSVQTDFDEFSEIWEISC